MLVTARRFGFLLLVSMLGPTSVWAATNHVVNVGLGGLTFTPNTLSISQGDTVTFTYAGGTGSHNAATYGSSVQSFRCAADCASNGGASSNAWSDTITFNTPGTVTYNCEIHGFVSGTGSSATCSGMCGTITVNPSVPVELQSFDVGNR